MMGSSSDPKFDNIAGQSDGDIVSERSDRQNFTPVNGTHHATNNTENARATGSNSEEQDREHNEGDEQSRQQSETSQQNDDQRYQIHNFQADPRMSLSLLYFFKPPSPRPAASPPPRRAVGPSALRGSRSWSLRRRPDAVALTPQAPAASR